MGKNVQHKDPANMQLATTGNSGGMNKLFHALNRRHRWQNVRKGLPDKRKGSGKDIIDGETTEPVASTSQPPQVQSNRKKNKPQIEQSGTESGPVTKSSKKFRIKSLLSDEGTKRKGKGQRRSPSPTRSPRRSDSVKSNEHAKTPTKSNCESPLTMKKRKTNICAAMLTVSYLRQKAQAYEQQNNLEKQEKRVKNQKPTSIKMSSDGPTRLTKSLSFPLLGTTKRKDFEIEELKSKLRDCKDKETTKEKYILPMNQWKDDTLFPKPMLTRPASFKSPSLKGPSLRGPSSISQKENKQTTNQSKTLRQKIGKVMKENKEKDSRENRKKEKRRILMDAVFHKIPYGRRNSKDPKKVSAEKIKSNSTTSSTGSHRMAVDKANLKKTASTGEAMSKYRRLLSQRSIRDDKGHVNDHKPRLCVAADQSSGTNDRKTLKSIHSLPSIKPSDFDQNQEFPVKTQMDTHQSIASAILDDHKSLDHLEISAKINVPTPAIQKLVNETKLVDKHGTIGKSHGLGSSTSNHQEKNNPQKESSEDIETATKQTNLHNENEAFYGNFGEGPSTSDHQENESSDAIESELKETKFVCKDENSVVSLNTSINNENVCHQKESSDVSGTVSEEIEIRDENLGVSLNTSKHKEDTDNQTGSSAANESKANENGEGVKENLDASPNNFVHEEETDNQKETSVAKESPEIHEVENDKSFNEILGMFKEVAQKKLEDGNEPNAPVSKVVIKCTIDHNDQSVDENLEDGGNTLNTQEEESSPLTSGHQVEESIQDLILESPSLIDIPQSTFEGNSDEKQQNLFSVDDQPSTSNQPFIHNKRPNNAQPMDVNATSTTNDKVPKNGFLHLNLESVKDNAEFQFVKEVLEMSGFLSNEVLGEWYSSYQPIDPLLFEELEASFLRTKNLEAMDSMKDEEDAQKIINDHHLLLFDLINEALLEIHNKTCTFCPNPLIYGSKVRPMPVGYRVLEEVWENINMYLSWRPNIQPSLDDAVTRDMEKGDGWMNLQADAEFVGIELEEMIADDLLDELVFDDLLM